MSENKAKEEVAKVQEKNAGDHSESDEGDEVVKGSLNCSNELAALLRACEYPEDIKRKVNALKNLQMEAVKIDAEFYKEMHALECRFSKLIEPLLEKRKQIINGDYVPEDEECVWKTPEEANREKMEQLTLEDKDKEAKGDAEKPVVVLSEAEKVNGIPEFWVTAMRNVPLLSDYIQDHDVPVLNYLTDVKCSLMENPMGFKLEFYFAPNEYFTDTVLTKTYELKCSPDDASPLHFDGPEITKCSGCPINWKPGKNVTMKKVVKKQKRKGKGPSAVRTVVKMVKTDSFFDYFSPPELKEDAKDDDEEANEIRDKLEGDYEIGHFIKERLVPKAILYFTGDLFSDDEYDDDEDEFEEEEEGCSDEDEEDDDSDDDGKPPAKEKSQKKGGGKGHGRGSGGGGGGTDVKGYNSTDCRTQ